MFRAGLAGKIAGFGQGAKGAFQDFGMGLGRLGGWKGNPKDYSGMARRGYRRMGYMGGGALGTGMYMHHRSSGRNGLRGRASGSY